MRSLPNNITNDFPEFARRVEAATEAEAAVMVRNILKTMVGTAKLRQTADATDDHNLLGGCAAVSQAWGMIIEDYGIIPSDVITQDEHVLLIYEEKQGTIHLAFNYTTWEWWIMDENGMPAEISMQGIRRELQKIL
jgi:hypothetical protein